MTVLLQERIEKLRKENNLLQKDVAQLIGVARTTYASYESGKREPNLINVMKIAYLYGVSVDYIIGFEKNLKTNAS